MDELISRQAAIDEIDDWGYEFVERENIDAMLAAVCIKYSIERITAAEPEIAKRVVGKSISGTTMWYQCDRCGEPIDVKDRFCSGCGRKLVNG